MSGRVQKSLNSDSLRKSALADHIRLNGRSIMPCSRCFKAKKACRMLPREGSRSQRCEGCARDRKPCDGNLVASQRLFSFSAILRFSLLIFPQSVGTWTSRNVLIRTLKRPSPILPSALLVCPVFGSKSPLFVLAGPNSSSVGCRRRMSWWNPSLPWWSVSRQWARRRASVPLGWSIGTLLA